MDYTKLTKQELLDLLNNQEDNEVRVEYAQKQLHQLEALVKEKEKALEDQIKARDAAIVKNIQLEEEIKGLKSDRDYKAKIYKEEKEVLEKNYNFLEEKFSDLAKLFEEYMLAFKDQVKLSEVMNKNNNYVLQALELKIKKFNGSDSE